MEIKYTEQELNSIDKTLLIKMFLNLQNQMETLTVEMKALNDKMQKMMEQLVLANNNRFGRKTEKMSDTNQICFMEVDGKIVFFNEAEAVSDLDANEPGRTGNKCHTWKEYSRQTCHGYGRTSC